MTDFPGSRGEHGPVLSGADDVEAVAVPEAGGATRDPGAGRPGVGYRRRMGAEGLGHHMLVPSGSGQEKSCQEDGPHAGSRHQDRVRNAPRPYGDDATERIESP